MKRLFCFAFLLALSATAHADLVEDAGSVKGGMSEARVKRILGNPLEKAVILNEYLTWIYKSGNDKCSVFFSNGKTTGAALCVDDAPTVAITPDPKQETRARTVKRHSQAARWQYVSDNLSNRRSFGDFYKQNQQGVQPFSGQQCVGLAPTLQFGCHAVCINGAWSSICN